MSNQDHKNEGFSGKNIDKDYNPSDEPIEDRLKAEKEINKLGDTKIVDRARDSDDSLVEKNHNAPIKNSKNLENRDNNYDPDPNRYPNSDPDNKKNRGNMELDE